jgi:hypothetical protein
MIRFPLHDLHLKHDRAHHSFPVRFVSVKWGIAQSQEKPEDMLEDTFVVDACGASVADGEVHLA